MPKFMNDELRRIRDNLKCAHCESMFKGSDSQAWKVKYEDRAVYCSPLCRQTAIRARFSKPIPNRGPCGQCGKEFFSRTAKQFCSVRCYIASPLFRAISCEALKKATASSAKNGMARRKGAFVPCLECSVEFYQKPSRPRKFCSKVCYRAFFAKRFDRWIANPEGIALPQCYDEFLDRETLPCIVDGCEWQGKHLSVHVNSAHGIKAQDFKRVAGFNLNTGVISKPLAQALSERAKVGVALSAVPGQMGYLVNAQDRERTRYYSLEGREHHQKARALAGPGPQRQCMGCGTIFIQSTSMGRALYCTPHCRDSAYARQRRSKQKQLGAG